MTIESTNTSVNQFTNTFNDLSVELTNLKNK